MTAACLLEQIERIVDSDLFRRSPALADLLRRLAAASLEGDRGRAEASGGGSKDTRTRVQMTRLRQGLAAYYDGPGSLDPLLIELPLRSTQLRIVSRDRLNPVALSQAADRPVLVIQTPVVESPLGGDSPLPRRFSQLLVTELGRFRSIRTVLPEARGLAGHDDPFSPLPQDEQFVLSIALEREPGRVLVCGSLTHSRDRHHVWADSLELVAGERDEVDLRQAAAWLAATLADETGVICLDLMRSSAEIRPERCTVNQAVLSVWRYWLTMRREDREYAARALAAVVTAVPTSGLALAYHAAIQVEDYISSRTNALKPPRRPGDLLERARSLAPGDPWVEQLRGFFLVMDRRMPDVNAIIQRLEQLPASGNFTCMLAALMLSAGHLERAHETFKQGLPQVRNVPHWYLSAAAFAAFATGDFSQAAAHLEPITTRTDPQPMLLRAALAVAQGDIDQADSFADEVTAIDPDFPAYGEIILRRVMPDCVVDPVAAAINTLGRDWFT